jgi:leucyl/phenylalanyl-tRNA--protein transferase
MANTIPPGLLLDFYRRGLFPMAISGELRLFSPDPRGILPLDGFRIPHGSRKTIRDPAWDLRVDTAFAETLHGCAGREDTWIDGTIFRSYLELHREGHAHSVEAWREGRLAGGLYGVRIGGAFFGESMFSLEPGASKAALNHLVGILKKSGFLLLDIQWVTQHLEKFGAVQIPRAEYLDLLEAACNAPAVWNPAGVAASPPRAVVSAQ